MPRPQQPAQLIGAISTALALHAVANPAAAQTSPVQWQQLTRDKQQLAAPKFQTTPEKNPAVPPVWLPVPQASGLQQRSMANTPTWRSQPRDRQSGDLSGGEITNPVQIDWVPVPTTKPQQPKGQRAPTTQHEVKTEEWGNVVAANTTAPILWQKLQSPATKPHPIIWTALPAGAQDHAQIRASSLPSSSPLPPEPKLQALNRSISFAGDGPGPDLAWKVPQGFRWSEDWFLDANILGANARPPNSSFWAWNNGDATGEIHLRVYQQRNWSFGINATFRSVYQGNSFAGGTTGIGDGFATGFRLDYALSASSGLAVGAEQLIQYDSSNDTGRNLYVVGSKGWWLGGHAGKFPLVIGTAGVGTGRLGDNQSLQFACTSSAIGILDVSTGSGSPLCWSPIGSAAMLLNNNWSIFSEYNSQDWLAGLSLSANDSFPMRLSWGVLLANKGTNYNFVGLDNLRWFFRASLGL